MANEISKEYDDNKCSNFDCSDDPLSNSELSPCELLFEDERLLGDDPSGDELSEISSSRELNFSKYELVQTDEDDGSSKDDKGSKDYKDYKDYEGEECNECEEDKEYKEYNEEGQECQECQKGEDDTDASLQDFMKQHKHLEHAELQQRKDACETAKLEPEPELHRPTCLKNPFGCNDEPRGDPEFNIGSQQAESKDE